MLNVVTANLYRLNNVYPWLGRRRGVTDLLISSTADILCLQETPEDYEEFLVANLTPIGQWRVGSDLANCPILYRSDKLRVVSSKGFTLSGTTRARYGSGAVFEEIETGHRFCVVSVHPASPKDGPDPFTDRLNQIQQLWSELALWGVPALPLVVAGDMNDSGRSSVPGVAQSFLRLGMIDALDVIPDSLFINRIYSSVTGWKPSKKNGLHIDRAFANEHFRFVAAQLLLTGLLSDHNFIRFTLEFVGSESLPVPSPPKQTTADDIADLLKRSPLKSVSAAKVNAAIKGRYLSRYAYMVQLWLQQPKLTGRWSKADQAAYDLFRKERGIPGGDAGVWSLGALALRAKTLGIKVYPVVK